jgi:hypothetical protein
MHLSFEGLSCFFKEALPLHSVVDGPSPATGLSTIENSRDRPISERSSSIEPSSHAFPNICFGINFGAFGISQVSAQLGVSGEL